MIKKLSKNLIIILCIVTLCVFSSPSVAWFSRVIKYNFPSVNGSSAGSYFERGKGTADDPYIISNPVHLYNLAWLQYLGYFNKAEVNNGRDQSYFKLKNDIDMSGWILPPIGTTRYPFLGNFNGNYKTVSNLIVSNKDGSKEDNKIYQMPVPVSTNGMGETAEIVGFFGVVGKYKNNDVNVTLTSGVNEVHDLKLQNLNVYTGTGRSLIGLLAGYVNSAVSNVAVGESSINIEPNVKNMPDVTALSIYSLIGAYYKDQVGWDTPTGDGSGGGAGGAGGAGEGFGGSMDMYTLIRRLTYMYSENLWNNKTYPVVMYYGGPRAGTLTKHSYAPDYTFGGTNIISYLNEGSILALNVDTETMFDGADSTYTLDNFSFLTNNYYKTNNTESISNKNTGYIVGGGIDPGDVMIRTRIQKLASGSMYKGIYRSLGTEENPNATFSRNNFDMLTIDAAGNTYVIQDSSNVSANTAFNDTVGKTVSELGLSKKYESVVTGLTNMLTKGNGMIYGLRFFKGQDLSAGMLTTECTSAHYEGKHLLNGAISFNLQNAGYITTVAGTFGEQSGDHNMFNLYKVEYGSDGKIDLSKSFEITEIWVKKNSSGSVPAVKYNDDDEIDSSYEKVYDSSKMSTLSEINAAYYFELPVTQGDYVLTGKARGAYLLYLDIGANAGMGDQGGGEITPSQKPEIEGVNFFDSTKMSGFTDGDTYPADDESYPLITYNISLTGSNNTGGISVKYKRNGANSITTTHGATTEFTVVGYCDGTVPDLAPNSPQTVSFEGLPVKKEEDSAQV